MTDRRDDDLADAVEELSSQLETLRDELERDAPRGPLGLPRPPSPGEVLRFTDEVAIPGTIAILEANVRLLETVQRAIRFAERGERARERTADATSTAAESADRLADVSDRTLKRLEGSLSDLQRALEAGPVPDDEAGRELLDEARALRDDVRSRLRDAGREDHPLEDFEDRADRADAERRASAESVDAAGPGADRDPDAGGDDATEVQVDVDAELETLKDRYGDDRDGSDPAGSAPAGSDPAGSAPDGERGGEGERGGGADDDAGDGEGDGTGDAAADGGGDAGSR